MHEEIREMKNRRNDIAQRARKIRQQFGNKFARVFIAAEWVPMKPTIKNFEEQIDDLLAIANAPIIPSMGEYYTRCGWEDGQYESRQDARREAERLQKIVETM